MGGHVFICYDREDSSFVLKLAANLKGRGVPVWLDQWDIPLGANWNATIDDALYSSEHFLIVLSPNSVGSNEVSGELLLALENKKHIVPVLYQSCRIPRQLLPIQRADFTPCSPDDETALRNVLRALGIEASTSPGKTETSVEEDQAKLPVKNEKNAQAWRWHVEGNVFYDQKKYDDAFECYGKAIELDPLFKLARINRELTHKKL